jgi:hypothetical protein
MQEANVFDFQAVAMKFTEALTDRDYSGAYILLSTEYQNSMNADQLKEEFEKIVPPDWGDTGHIHIGTILDDWPDKQPSDLGWVYVSIGGDVYSEGLTLVLMSENGNARVREVQFGRP